uniref:hypothetical protein n=1 Tax=Eubacterium sp. TaxID=142586 RepID=UPI003FEFE681
MSIIPFVVSFIVNKHTNEIQPIDVLYAVNAKKEPAGSSKSPEVSTPPTGSTISISNLLDCVNNYFPDILPESVLKHYGYSSRPEGNIGKSALLSRDVNIDEFDDTDYNEIRLGKKEYAAVSSAITIRYANRYSDEIRSINYGDYKYYFIYNENGIRYYDRYNIEKYLKGMDDYEIHRKAKNNNRLSGLLEASERYDSSSLSSNENGRTAGNIDSLDREALQAERQSDRYGYRKDADNDNTSKKRYSRDVDYAEYAQHIVRFLKQI